MRAGLPQEPPPVVVDLPLRATEEPPFLRPKTRTRVRRVRRGWAGRMILALQASAVVAAVVLAGWMGYAKVMASERLRVTKVEVEGAHFLSQGEVRELLGRAVGENILEVNLGALASRLKASPWVADATVRRALPDTLQVIIQERVPLALAEVDRLYLMDADGVLIDLYGPRTAGFDLPIVRGLAGVDGEARADRARRAGVLLADLGDLAEEISEVHVEPSGDLRVVLRGPGEVVRLGRPPYKKKFETFLALRSDLRARVPDAEYFDLRFKDRIYAKRRAPVEAARAEAGPGVPAAEAAEGTP